MDKDTTDQSHLKLVDMPQNCLIQIINSNNLGIEVSKKLMNPFVRPKSSKFSSQFINRKYEDTSLNNATRMKTAGKRRENLARKRMKKKNEWLKKKAMDMQKKIKRIQACEAALQKKKWEENQRVKAEELKQLEKRAILIIQQKGRSYIKYKLKLYEKKKELSATIIQSQIRRRLTQKRVYKIRTIRRKQQEKAAVVNIQRVFRGYSSRKNSKVLLKELFKEEAILVSEIVSKIPSPPRSPEKKVQTVELEEEDSKPSPPKWMPQKPKEIYIRVGGGFCRSDLIRNNTVGHNQQAEKLSNNTSKIPKSPLKNIQKSYKEEKSVVKSIQSSFSVFRSLSRDRVSPTASLFNKPRWGGVDTDVFGLWNESKNLEKKLMNKTMDKTKNTYDHVFNDEFENKLLLKSRHIEIPIPRLKTAPTASTKENKMDESLVAEELQPNEMPTKPVQKNSVLDRQRRQFSRKLVEKTNAKEEKIIFLKSSSFKDEKKKTKNTPMPYKILGKHQYQNVSSIKKKNNKNGIACPNPSSKNACAKNYIRPNSVKANGCGGKQIRWNQEKEWKRKQKPDFASIDIVENKDYFESRPNEVQINEPFSGNRNNRKTDSVAIYSMEKNEQQYNDFEYSDQGKDQHDEKILTNDTYDEDEIDSYAFDEFESDQ